MLGASRGHPNAFSKKSENLKHRMALHLLHYNYVRRHMTLKTTPAEAAGIADGPWTMGDLLDVLERVEQRQMVSAEC